MTEKVKRPAFQFYPADWRKDVELRSCSIAARGLWIDLLCLAHECDPYGHLTVNGLAMTPKQMAGQVGLTAAQCTKLLQELVDNGVARKTDGGAVYSKRMVDDEDLRQRRAEGGKAGSEFGAMGAEHGSKGGRPRKDTGDKKPPLQPPLEPPPSSSSSSSELPPIPPKGGDDPAGFAEFWNSWPTSHRKQDRKKCAAKWKRSGYSASLPAIVAHIEALKQSKQWRDGFEPAPLTYLNGERWGDGLPAELESTSEAGFL